MYIMFTIPLCDYLQSNQNHWIGRDANVLIFGDEIGVVQITLLLIIFQDIPSVFLGTLRCLGVCKQMVRFEIMSLWTVRTYWRWWPYNLLYNIT